jgi:transcriptional regulator with GAF, ATPase, and Fis domain
LKIGGATSEAEILTSAMPLSFGGEQFVAVIGRDLATLYDSLRSPELEGRHGLIGDDPKMLQLLETVREVGAVDVPVLIQGESGTGKELVARALHYESGRRRKNLTIVGCGGLSEEILESELFGHVKGAFTGATRDRKGRFELAHGSTIFLDEIGECSPAMQVRLLRVLSEGSFEPVGDERTQRTDARVISATNRDLEREVSRGRFRSDLFYRLSVVLITVPPLRERAGDIRVLADYFLRSFAVKYRVPHRPLSPDAISLLESYRWPGNVRELENAMNRAVVRAEGDVVTPNELPRAVLGLSQGLSGGPVKRRRHLTTAQVERALAETGGNKFHAARLLGIGRATLYRFLARQQQPPGTLAVGESSPDRVQPS